MKIRRTPLALLASAASLAVACGASPDDERLAESSSSALTQSATDVVTNADLPGYASILAVAQSTTSFANGTLSFVPSIPLFSLGGVPRGSFAYPPIGISTPLGALVAVPSNLSLDMSTLTYSFVGNELVLTIKGSGAFSLSGNVTPTINVSSLTLTARLGYDATSDGPVLDSMSTSWTESVSGCGLLDWCDSIVQGDLPDPNTMMGPVRTAFQGWLAAGNLNALFAEIRTLKATSGSPPPSDTTPWAYAPHTASIANGAMTFHVNDDVSLPKPPTGCFLGPASCSGTLMMSCTASESNAYVLQCLSGSTWSTVVSTTAAAGAAVDLLAYSQFGSGATSYRACAENAAGDSCAPAAVVTLSPNNTCVQNPCQPGYALCDGKCEKGGGNCRIQ
jgi:hypothetical protein